MSMNAHDFIDNGIASNRSEMDRMYRFQRHIYDASRRFYLLGRDKLISDLDVPTGGTVLEVGCGTGRNLIKVAQAYPEAKVYGFDISDEMLKTAAQSIWKAGLTDRVRIAQGDALRADPHVMFGIGTFDRIYFSYALSMIPDWKMALAHAVGSLSREGVLRVVDFGQCEDLPRSVKALLVLWLRQFGVEPRADIEPELSRLASRLGRTCSFSSDFKGYSWHLAMNRVAI